MHVYMYPTKSVHVGKSLSHANLHTHNKLKNNCVNPERAHMINDSGTRLRLKDRRPMGRARRCGKQSPLTSPSHPRRKPPPLNTVFIIRDVWSGYGLPPNPLQPPTDTVWALNPKPRPKIVSYCHSKHAAWW